MRTVRVGWMVAAVGLALAACGDEGGEDGGGASATGGSSSSGTGGSSSSGTGGSASSGTGGNSSSSGEGGGVELVPYCLPACTTTADCNLGSAPYDADNYGCEQGACIYQGCNSETECQTINLTCHDVGGLPICLLPCSVPSAATRRWSGYGADSYACEAGRASAAAATPTPNADLGGYLCRDGGGVDLCASCITSAGYNLGSAPTTPTTTAARRRVRYHGCSSTGVPGLNPVCHRRSSREKWDLGVEACPGSRRPSQIAQHAMAGVRPGRIVRAATCRAISAARPSSPAERPSR